MFAITQVSLNNQIVVPVEFRKFYGISAGDEISWTKTDDGILFNVVKKVTEEDIIGLIKKDLPYNSVEIKKRRTK